MAQDGPDPLVDDEFSETRWPMAGAVVVAMVLTWLLPADLRFGPSWGLTVVEALLLAVVIFGDPGAIDRRSRVLRAFSIGLVSVLVFDTIWATVRLIDSLVTGGPETNSASALLSAGALVWVSNIVVFTLLYYEIDGGGPADRAHRLAAYPDFGFPQQLNPHIAPAAWRPRFFDYLYLGCTNAMAFSPTDVMPLTLRAKLPMTAQSLISVVILGLVVARAVNVFT